MFSLPKRLFGKEARPTGPARDVHALMRPLATPAVHIVASGMASSSCLGGVPDLPAGVAWLQHDGTRLTFLAQLSLSDIQAAHVIDWLPATGTLLFFYDLDEQSWGFNPRDRGTARVLHLPSLPATPCKTKDDLMEGPSALPRLDVAFRSIAVFPSPDRAAVEALDLSDDESDDYCDAAEAVFDNRPQHQIAGYPAPIQADAMELDCQLVTNGLYLGTPDAYASVAAKQLASGAEEWVLLLQLDTDDDLDVMWGDGGRLYYWVKKEAARAGDFSNVWVILQSS